MFVLFQKFPSNIYILEHNGYMCEPSSFYSFDIFANDIVFDESRKGNNGKPSKGTSGIDGKL